MATNIETNVKAQESALDIPLQAPQPQHPFTSEIKHLLERDWGSEIFEISSISTTQGSNCKQQITSAETGSPCVLSSWHYGSKARNYDLQSPRIQRTSTTESTAYTHPTSSSLTLCPIRTASSTSLSYQPSEIENLGLADLPYNMTYQRASNAYNLMPSSDDSMASSQTIASNIDWMQSLSPLFDFEKASAPHTAVQQKRSKPRCWDYKCNGRPFSTSSNSLRHQKEKSGTALKSYCPKCGAEITRTTAKNSHLAGDKGPRAKRAKMETNQNR